MQLKLKENSKKKEKKPLQDKVIIGVVATICILAVFAVIVFVLAYTIDNKPEDIKMETVVKQEKAIEENIEKIASAVGKKKDSRDVVSIEKSLRVIKAGKIQAAEFRNEDGEDIVNIIAEDGTIFKVYLNPSGSVDVVKNLDTGKWEIQSYK